MKAQILSHLNDPGQLERLYQEDKSTFRRSFNELYPDPGDSVIVRFWHERLNFKKDQIGGRIKGNDLVFLVIAVVLAGLIAKIPDFFGIDEDFFFPRNIGFIVFPFLMAFFAWKNRFSNLKKIILICATLGGLFFINSFPRDETSDTLLLSCIHLILFLWCLLGLSYVGDDQHNPEKRLAFLRYNGDLVVLTAIILIAGGLMTGITLTLFSLIDLNIENFYFEYVVVFGLAAVPIVNTYLTQANPGLVGKVSPLVAKIFSPLVLSMLIIYLIAMAVSGKDPYNDREFLLFFNLLLVGVMAIILFSVAETSKISKHRAQIIIISLLSLVTIIVNAIALSAILFRISEWGITPNRVAVLGGNMLILVNLIWVTVQLYRVLFQEKSIQVVGHAIAKYLPLYFLWATLVTFLFPVLFSYR